jgi:membrane-associated phospholipid phosphatase
MEQSFGDFVTDFADQAVVLPLAITAAILLAAGGWRRGALAWTFVMTGVLGSVMVLKLVASTCGYLLPVAGFHSPSGHTASAAMVYGGLPAIVLRPFSGRARWALLLALAAAGCIGASRLLLHVHTVSEVLAGGAVGIAGAVLLSRLAGRRPMELRFRQMAMAGGLIILVLHGFRLPAEAAIQRMSFRIWPLSECVAGDPVHLALSHAVRAGALR